MISIVAIMTILLAVLALVVVNALAESPWGLFTIAGHRAHRCRHGPDDARRARFVAAGLDQHVRRRRTMLAAVWGGRYLPGTALESWLTLSRPALSWWLMGYGVVAAVLPVWLLLAPRDYLSTFMKIGTVALLGLAIVWLAPVLKMPALTRFHPRQRPDPAGGRCSRSASSPSPARPSRGSIRSSRRARRPS